MFSHTMDVQCEWLLFEVLRVLGMCYNDCYYADMYRTTAPKPMLTYHCCRRHTQQR
jgi:hypothetical protein